MKNWFEKVDRRALSFGLGLFVLAFLLRLIGIGWGIPNYERQYSLHPDEPIIFFYSQQVEPAKFDFTPGFYNYGTFYLSVLRVATDITASYGGGPTGESLEEQNVAVGRFHMAGRVISALAGAGIVWVIFLLLYRRTHILGACLGAAAAGVAPGLVMHSRFQTVDVLATFFICLSLLYATKLVPIAEEELPGLPLATRFAALAGVFAGLSAGTKYTGILAVICLFVCAWPYAQKWRLMGIGLGAAILVFLITTPGAFLETEKFWTDFRYEMTHTATGHGLVFAATANGFVYHLTNLVIAFGLGTALIGLAGLGRAIFRRHLWAVALVVFALAYYILIGRAEVKFLRYVFPLIPVFAVGFGWIIGRAHVYPKSSMKLVAFFGIIALGFSLMSTVKLTGWMAGVDPRDASAKWLQSNVASGERVGLVSDPWFYTPTLYPQAAAPRYVPFDVRRDWWTLGAKPPVAVHVEPDVQGVKQWDVRLLEEERPEYVVFSSFEFDDLDRISRSPGDRERYAAEYQAFKEFGEVLSRDYEAVEQNFDPQIGSSWGSDYVQTHDMMYIRPRVWIWKRKASP